MAFAGENTPGIRTAIAFTAGLAGLSEVGIEVTAVKLVIPDIAINGGMTDGEDMITSQPTGRLFGAPVQPQ